MKCVILAFDGLEYDFVEKFGLDNLKQEEYGKVIIPQECCKRVHTAYSEEAFLEPFTPLVWFSFLTGQLPTSDRFLPMRWDNKVIDTLQILWRKLARARSLNRVMGKGNFYARVWTRFGFRKRASKTQDYGVPTIFELTEKSYDINVPVYSEEWNSWGLEGRPDDFGDFKDFINFTLEIQLLEFNKLRNRTLLFLEQNRDWQLLMVYFKTLDAYGELCFANTKKLFGIYAKFDNFVKEVRERLDAHTLVLIISDHGIESLGKTPFGKHSDQAFYSVNKPLELTNPKITDFYALIRRVLDQPST